MTNPDTLVERLDSNFFDGTLAEAVELIADCNADPVESSALYEASRRLKWAAEQLTKAHAHADQLAEALEDIDALLADDVPPTYRTDHEKVIARKARAALRLAQGGPDA